MKKNQTYGSIILFITSLLWGCAFVAQKVGMEHIEPLTFCAIRFSLSSIFLFIVVVIRDVFFTKQNSFKKINLFKKDSVFSKPLLIGGILCGLALTAGTCLQQYGLQQTTAGKSGFITALYIVLVPLFGLFIKKRVKVLEWVSVGIALISLVLLCFQKKELSNSFTITKYDIYLLICSIFFSIQILLIDHFSKDNDCLMMSMLQFSVCAIIATILMFIFEKPNLESIIQASIPLLYAGIASGGIAYTLQFVGQKYTPPTIASIIMSLEAAISLIAGAIIINEVLTGQELIGCFLMLVAILIPQIPYKKLFHKNQV